jgi:hypothetical protein
MDKAKAEPGGTGELRLIDQGGGTTSGASLLRCARDGPEEELLVFLAFDQEP